MSDIKRIRLIATDLDGTLLRDDKTISGIDLETLLKLEQYNIIRVAATGRSLHKVNEVLLPDSPFDYVVFSSGGGVFDWKKKELMVSEHFATDISILLCCFLIRLKLNFIVFKPIPQNNLFCFHRGAGVCSEFDNYLHRHTGDFSALNMDSYYEEAGQFMAVIPNNEILFDSISNKLKSTFDGIRVIRSTSPVDPRFIWLEIFPDTVSKGHGIKWVCDRLEIDYSATAGIGNDFNDIDMLDFVGHPFILGNSTPGLLGKYPSVDATNNKNGFSKVVQLFGLFV
jgi:Cof subfamily protein (haloacid dehalogenase superfamily)